MMHTTRVQDIEGKTHEVLTEPVSLRQAFELRDPNTGLFEAKVVAPVDDLPRPATEWVLKQMSRMYPEGDEAFAEFAREERAKPDKAQSTDKLSALVVRSSRSVRHSPRVGGHVVCGELEDGRVVADVNVDVLVPLVQATADLGTSEHLGVSWDDLDRAIEERWKTVGWGSPTIESMVEQARLKRK